MKDQLVRLLGLDNGNNSTHGVRDLPVEMVRPNPFQPRQIFSDHELEELAASIGEFGILQPIVVRTIPQGYELVAGERRLRACRLLGKATIPALIRDLSDYDVAVLAMVENLQREDLNFLEEAQGYQRLLAEFGFTQDELAKRIGKSQSTIANKLRLLRLPDRVQMEISREIITERHARALLKLVDEEQQLQVVEKIVKDGLNVQQTEQYIEGLLAGGAKVKKKGGRKRLKGIYKDMRIFVNTIRQAANELQRVGFSAQVEEVEKEDFIEVTVRIPKKRD